MTIDEIAAPSILVALAIYLLKTTFDMIAKRSGKNSDCGLTADSKLLIKQTHDVVVDTNLRTIRHFDEVSNIVKSIEGQTRSIEKLTSLISKSQNDYTKTLELQTKILDKIADSLVVR